MKQALAAQGFKGGSSGNTEWSQWVQSEKENLAIVMGRYGIEWEHKGTHKKHLSVLDYKKQEWEKEVVQLEGQILEKNRNKVAEPLVQKLKSLVKTALIRCFEAWDSCYRLNATNSNLHSK